MAEQTLAYRLTSVDRLVMKNRQAWRHGEPPRAPRRAVYEPNPDAVGRDFYMEHLYMGEDGPVIPGEMVEEMLSMAAKERRVPVTCADAPLEYDGPRTADGLWNERTFAVGDWYRPIDLATAKPSEHAEQVFYPAFQKWAVTVEVTIDTDVVSPEQVDAWMEYASRYFGLGDGRFAVVKAGWLQEPVDRRPLNGRFRAQRS